MKREGVDVLLMQNNNDHMGGYVKYFTDMPATNGYPNTVIFPADDEMTVVCQGPFNGDSRPPADIVARRQAHAHHAELRVGAFHPVLRSRARRQGAAPYAQAPPSASSASTRCRSRWATSS